MSHAKSAEKVVQDIRRKTRRRFSAEEKIRIVLEGMRGEESRHGPSKSDRVTRKSSIKAPSRDMWWFSTRDQRGGPRFLDRLLRWSPDPTGGIWNATKETELPG